MATAIDHETGRPQGFRPWMLFAIVLAFLGFASYSAVWEWLAHDSARWPKTQGLVTGHGSRKLPVRRTVSRPPQFEAVVFYDYTADGTLYHSERLAIHFLPEYTSTTHEGAVRTGGMRFPDASTVDVYYNPTFPSIAILVRTPADWTMPLILAAPGVFLLVMFLVCRSGGRDGPK